MLIPTHTMPILTESDINRFWSKVGITAQKDKCWQWLAGVRRRGYGRFSIRLAPNKDGSFVASRIAYFLHTKNDPAGKVILHACDNPTCVNPHHLIVGTNKDNTHDMMEKGRGSKQFEGGSNHKMAKLTEQKVLEIRKLYSKGINQKEISVLYGVSSSAITLIVTRKRWKHI